ncbi:MAG: AMP-binding protein [Candidatus Hodarchaeales archaeon]|jgi:long-chain acyl-CoA synthetase
MQFWKKSYDKGITDLDSSIWETTLTQAIRPTFEEFGDNLALEYMGVHVTFGDLDHFSNKFAHMLLKKGFRKGDVVGLNMANMPQFVIALLGVLKIGCVVTGVSPLMSEDQILYQLKDSGAKGLVTLDAVFAARIVKIAPELPDLKLIVTTGVGDFLPKLKQILGKLVKKIPTGKITPLEGKKIVDMWTLINSDISSSLPDVYTTPDDLAFVLYTGGTTGPPKGAMLTHRNFVSNMIMVQTWLDWTRGTGTALSGFPFFHVAGLTFCLNCLYLGWPQLLVPNPRDTDLICDLIKKYRPTALVNVPSLFQMLIKNPKFKNLDHSKLDTCISSAAPFPVETQKELESVVGKGKLLELYGMTECSPVTTMNPYRGTKKLGSVGLPLMNTDIKLVDPESGKEVPIGEPGEIHVKGPQIMKGYLNKPEETKNTIDDDGYLRTGDVAVFDEDGYLKIVDRTKDMLIVGGFKVFSSKVEDIIVKHPSVETIAIVGTPNPDRPGSEIVKGYFVISSDANIGNEEDFKSDLTEWMKEKLAPYEVPKIIELREELPLTLVGKVDKKLLRNK